MNPESPQFEESEEPVNPYQTLSDPEKMGPTVDKDEASQQLSGTAKPLQGDVTSQDIPLPLLQLFNPEHGAKAATQRKHYSLPINKKSVGPLEVDRDFSTARIRRRKGITTRRKRAQEALDAIKQAQSEDPSKVQSPSEVENQETPQLEDDNLRITTTPDASLLLEEMTEFDKNNAYDTPSKYCNNGCTVNNLGTKWSSCPAHTHALTAMK